MTKVPELKKEDELISRKRAIDAMLQLQREDEEMYGALIPEGFDGERAAEKLKELPVEQPEITLEQVEEYCRQRCLSIITNDMLYHLIHGQQKSKPGKWIFAGDCYKCSECGTVYGWWADSLTSKYCPNCGARMEVDKG